MATALSLYIFTPSTSANFFVYASLFVVSLFNPAYTPTVVYSIVPALRSLTLNSQSAFLDDSCSFNYILGYLETPFATLVWPIYTFSVACLLASVVLFLVNKKVKNRAAKILLKRVSNIASFARSGFISYEPIVIVMALFALRLELTVVDTVLLALFPIIFAVELGLSARLLSAGESETNRAFLLASDGPILHLQAVLYSFVAVFKFPVEACFAAIFAVLYGFLISLFLAQNIMIRRKEKARLEMLRSVE